MPETHPALVCCALMALPASSFVAAAAHLGLGVTGLALGVEGLLLFLALCHLAVFPAAWYVVFCLAAEGTTFARLLAFSLATNLVGTVAFYTQGGPRDLLLANAVFFYVEVAMTAGVGLMLFVTDRAEKPGTAK